MPTKTKAAGAAEPVYPNLERFVEATDRAAAEKLFAGTRLRLGEVGRGAKAPSTKKVLAALDRAEALLGQLYEVRARMEQEARAAKKARR